MCPAIVDDTTLKDHIPYDPCSFSLAVSIDLLLSSAKWMLAVLPCSRWCTHQWRFFHHSTHLEWYRHRARYPQHTYHDWEIERREGEHVYIHIRQADWRFWNFGRVFCHWMARVVFQVEVVLVLVSAVSVGFEEVRPCLLASSVFMNSLLCHFGK